MIKSSTCVLLHGTWLSSGAGEAAEPRERQSLWAAMYPHSIQMKQDGTSGNPGTGLWNTPAACRQEILFQKERILFILVIQLNTYKPKHRPNNHLPCS